MRREIILDFVEFDDTLEGVRKVGRDSVKVSRPKFESLPTEGGKVWSEDLGRLDRPIPTSLYFISQLHDLRQGENGYGTERI
jgi:hypothetical protein